MTAIYCVSNTTNYSVTNSTDGELLIRWAEGLTGNEKDLNVLHRRICSDQGKIPNWAKMTDKIQSLVYRTHKWSPDQYIALDTIRNVLSNSRFRNEDEDIIHDCLEDLNDALKKNPLLTLSNKSLSFSSIPFTEVSSSTSTPASIPLPSQRLKTPVSTLPSSSTVAGSAPASSSMTLALPATTVSSSTVSHSVFSESAEINLMKLVSSLKYESEEAIGGFISLSSPAKTKFDIQIRYDYNILNGSDLENYLKKYKGEKEKNDPFWTNKYFPRQSVDPEHYLPFLCGKPLRSYNAAGELNRLFKRHMIVFVPITSLMRDKLGQYHLPKTSFKGKLKDRMNGLKAVTQIIPATAIPTVTATQTT